MSTQVPATVLTDLKIISMLDIAEVGVTDRGATPYIKLGCGTRLFGVLPTEKERVWFGNFKNELPSLLTEDTFRVALDIAQRYIRGNGYMECMPKYTYLNPDYAMIDAGAYIGYGTLASAKKIGPKGIIYAIEPVPANFELLQRNIEENAISNAKPINACINSINGEAEFYIENRQSNSLHDNLMDHNISSSKKRQQKINLASITLDSLMDRKDFIEKDKPLFISLEINGGEKEALEGASQLLSEMQCYELHFPIRYFSATQNFEEYRKSIYNRLNNFEDIRITECYPFIYARKGSYGK